MELEPQFISRDVLNEKYCKGSESSPRHVRERVARALAEAESNKDDWYSLFLAAQCDGLIMAGRINSAAGTELAATLMNCAVQPVGDSIDGRDGAGYPGIFEALREAAKTMCQGGGVGYDFSRLRPHGALVRGTQTEASGPLSYMHIFDRACQTVESAGARRGAQMGMLRIDHPDIEAFVRAKDTGAFTNFNLSVAVTDEFMNALSADSQFPLVHAAQPSARLEAERRGADAIERRADLQYVYRRVKARALWDLIMRSTYDHGEPGVVYIDRVNQENNLLYCERLEAVNPCAEEPLPPYGVCCLASINLTQLVQNPFAPDAGFDWSAFEHLVRIGVRALDNVLEITHWPLPAQQQEAQSKRRIGLGFLGLGSTLAMLGIRYDTESGRAFAARVAECLRDTAYAASIELAKERGPFPMFDTERYPASAFVKRLPSGLREQLRQHGIRNSHLLAIAPTGTIALAFADNASSGLEPIFACKTPRNRRLANGETHQEIVLDHAYRLYVRGGGDPIALPPAFVEAHQISATDHALMVAAVQPFVDAAISKTVNIPTDYPFDEFADLYRSAWERGCKSLATFRPNPTTGVVLGGTEAPSPALGVAASQADADRRIELRRLPTPALKSLRWPSRPPLPQGNPAWCYWVRHPHGARFAVIIGHVESGGADCPSKAEPFEVFVAGAQAPRGLSALAINLSYDLYTRDRAWFRKKLDSLTRCQAPGEAFTLQLPEGPSVTAPSLVSAMAQLIAHRCHQIRAFEDITETPLLDALMSAREPKTGADGTLSWSADIRNAATGDDCVLTLKELVIRHGSALERRPYSIWLAGDYPRALDGLCKALSLDMRVIDPAWIAKKLHELVHYAEPQGEFFAPVPGQSRQQLWPSTIAYIAALVLHRFAMLKILSAGGEPLHPLGIVEPPHEPEAGFTTRTGGKRCDQCGAAGLVRIGGCDRCTQCFAIGACG